MASVTASKIAAMAQLFVAKRHIPKNVTNIAAPKLTVSALRQTGNSRVRSWSNSRFSRTHRFPYDFQKLFVAAVLRWDANHTVQGR